MLVILLVEVAESVTSAVADNIHYAADNLTSVVASAYSVFRQKTFEMQVNESDDCTKGIMKKKMPKTIEVKSSVFCHYMSAP
jgi:hypothetical protein